MLKIVNLLAMEEMSIPHFDIQYQRDELEDISAIIQTAIDEKQFIGGNELVGSIKKKYPYIIDQNVVIGQGIERCDWL